MTRLLLLAAILLCGSPSRAADPEYDYYRIANRARWEGEIIARTGITLNDDLPSGYQLCMVAPGADWALESKDPKVEADYLRLVDLVLVSDGLMNNDRDGGWVGTCGDVKREAPTGDVQRLENEWFKYCKMDVKVAQAHKYACVNKKVVPTGFVIVDSLKALLQSDHPATIKAALMDARGVKGNDRFFGPIIGKLVLNKSLPEDVRAQAAVTLAVIQANDLNGKAIASLWLDDKLKDETRVTAMNAFAFLVHYGDEHGAATSPALKDYLKELVGLNQAHYDDTTGKADAIGSAALCAAHSYPKAMQDALRSGH
jgi:hypothetical protein